MFETLLTIKQRDVTTTLMPLRETGPLVLTMQTGLPGKDGAPGPIGNGNAETYDPGDLTVYFENGMT